MEPVYDYEKLANKTEEEMKLHADLKEKRLEQVFAKQKPDLNKDQLAVAILGCPDHRLISSYAVTFQKLLAKPCAIMIFDKNTDHLQKMATVYQHDVTNPFPVKPFDIIYSHVLLKFIPKDKQYSVLRNSYDALADGGMAIHFLDEQDVTLLGDKLPDGWNTVALKDHEKELDQKGIKYFEVATDVTEFIPEKYENSVHGVKTVALVITK